MPASTRPAVAGEPGEPGESGGVVRVVISLIRAWAVGLRGGGPALERIVPNGGKVRQGREFHEIRRFRVTGLG
ncbi:hypothetical protein GCM10009738_14590 [Kitasatospora viridis]